jgi:uncharacterized protein (DUF1800 family)
MDKQLKLQHFLWRTGFGPGAQSWDTWSRLDERAWWSKRKDDAAAKPQYFDVADTAIKGLLLGIGDVAAMERKDLDGSEKKQIREQSREDLRSLNLIWLEEMTGSKAQLREKMALFWHGHFASRNINILYQQQLLDVVRTHALGNFGDLLRGVSKSAAMLAFLNNQQNKKQQPNENFAREVMELFTLGRGHYTETDVKEAARAFTGWSFRLNGDFVFRPNVHDSDTKTVLGKTGKLTGDDVIDLLLEKRQTAHFIARKLYRFMVNEQKVPDDRVRWLGDRFFDSGYQIMRLLDDMVGSPWFYDAENMGCNIKSPVELWVGIRRVLSPTLGNPNGQLLIERALGQVLFLPPNVAGWPGGKTWIDSSSLMLRLRLPHILAAQDRLDVSTKDDDDQMMGQKGQSRLGQGMQGELNWQPLLQHVFAQTAEADTLRHAARWLWQTPQANPPAKVLEAFTNGTDRTRRIQSTVIQLMATPEYQLC